MESTDADVHMASGQHVFRQQGLEHPGGEIRHPEHSNRQHDEADGDLVGADGGVHGQQSGDRLRRAVVYLPGHQQDGEQHDPDEDVTQPGQALHHQRGVATQQGRVARHRRCAPPTPGPHARGA